MVSELPLDASGACWATNVENKGESAITTIAQKNKKLKKRTKELAKRNSGDKRQQQHDNNKDSLAIFWAP